MTTRWATIGPYQSIQHIKAKNKKVGRFFFQPETMSFFGSCVEEQVYGGRLFITSECYGRGHPRLYTIREALDNGDIFTAGKFQEYETLEQAVTAARALVDAAMFGGEEVTDDE